MRLAQPSHPAIPSSTDPIYPAISRVSALFFSRCLFALDPKVSGGKSTTNLSGPLAQLVEQRTLNPFVEGSSPSWPTKKEECICFLFFLFVPMTAAPQRSALPWRATQPNAAIAAS